MSAALRMARYRQRQRAGRRVVTIEVGDDDIEALHDAGFFDDQAPDDVANAIERSLKRLKEEGMNR